MGNAKGTHEWKSFWFPGAGLNEEFIPPAIEGFKAFCIVDIVHENAAVGSAIKRHPKRLESLLTCCVPNLYSSVRNRSLSSHVHDGFLLQWL